jgi:hypothetical protein
VASPIEWALVKSKGSEYYYFISDHDNKAKEEQKLLIARHDL